ncbi:MAG: DUF928 domain-containing protein [Microcoleaceae cyanobacterium]
MEKNIRVNSSLKLTQSRDHQVQYLSLQRWNFDQDGRPEPGQRKGAASRGNCPPTQPGLTALIPETNLGLTTKEYPTFWFYIPYSTTEIAQAELMLLDENQQPILEKPMKIQLSQTPGIVGITLPSMAKPLAVGQQYRWYFELECDAENPSKNPRVDGWVKRVTPPSELVSQLENNPTQQSYLAYAENGIWYDALTTLIQGIKDASSSKTFNQDWANLLEAVGLEELVQASTTDCCLPTSP